MARQVLGCDGVVRGSRLEDSKDLRLMGQGAVELVDSKMGPGFNREIIPDFCWWSSGVTSHRVSQYDQIYFNGSGQGRWASSSSRQVRAMRLH